MLVCENCALFQKWCDDEEGDDGQGDHEDGDDHIYVDDAENESLQRVIRMQRVGESFSANARAVAGKVVRPRRLLT